MAQNVSFKYGKFLDYKNLPSKDPGTLYFLENGQIYRGEQLMDTVHAVKNGQPIMGTTTDDEGFPQIVSDSMINNFFISLTSGKMKFATEEKELVDITAMVLEGILINQTFINRLLDALAEQKEIVMPSLYVKEDGHTLKWEGSNVEKLTVLIPKN